MESEKKRAFQDNLGYVSHSESELRDVGNGKGGYKGNHYVIPVEKGGYRGETEEEEEDPWKVTSLKMDYIPWDELSGTQKVIRVLMYFIKFVLVLGFLYLFICSLDFLSSAFKLLGGKKAGEVFQQQDILKNPVAGLMMGVLATVLVQSSSTSTSIVISMVGAKILDIQTAIPIVMGANIGTSVTNTIVALGQITDKGDFRRAFAGATVHDMFNWLTVIILLPLEAFTHYLYYISTEIVGSMHLEESLDVNQDLLKTITKPFTKLIIQVSSSGIKKIATGSKAEDQTLLKTCCDETKPASCCDDTVDGLDYYKSIANYSRIEKADLCKEIDSCVNKEYTDVTLPGGCLTTPWAHGTKSDPNPTLINSLNCTLLGGDDAQSIGCCESEQESSDFYSSYTDPDALQRDALCDTVNTTCFATTDVYSTCTAASSWSLVNVTKSGVGEVFDCGVWTEEVETTCNKQCEYLFKPLHDKHGLKDEAVGAILLVIALILLCVCLVAIVKLLHSLLQGPMAKAIKKFVNADFPGTCCGYMTGYLAILLGAGFTILVQSSSIFTSTLTPLVGIGVIELDRMYPLTLGSNIGTTATGILAALAQEAEDIPRSLTVAFAHLFFNISGILIFYPFPFFRPPIPAAKFLGNTTAKYRWFAVVYLIFMFFLFPLAIFGLSIIQWWALALVLIPIGLVLLFVLVVKCIQRKRPQALPRKLQNWKFLPKPLRSLEPYDSCMGKLCFCKRFQMEDGSDQAIATTGSEKRINTRL